jgi:hypothetical protein
MFRNARNDLRATGKSLCLLINRSKVEIRRITVQA